MLNIKIIPCLEDNFAYLIVNDDNHGVLIDCPEAAPINHELQKHDVKLEAVLITHHHYDHIDGLADLDLPDDVQILGAKRDAHRLPALTRALEIDEAFTLLGAKFRVLDGAGHTTGQIAYYCEAENWLFSADSLMLWGCGRLFEGSYEQAWDNLSKMAALPPHTQIYSGHDYLEMNARFALSLGWNLDILQKRLERARIQKAQNFVVPALLSDELATNPFLLCQNDDFAQHMQMSELSLVERFAKIRLLRDAF